jgi:L-glyceraldehyde 3-phosphate reductase
MGALAAAVHQGKALYAGISNYPPEIALEAIRLLKQMGAPCLIHQPKYSMFERWVEQQGLLNVLDENGVGCIAFSPLAQGMLTDKYINGIPEGSRAHKPHGFLKPEQITADKIKIIKKLNNFAIGRGQSLAQMALAWLLKDKRVTSVLIGASSVAQLNENLQALDNRNFSDDELKAIEIILSN